MSQLNDLIRARDLGRAEVAEPGLREILRQDLRPILRHDLQQILRRDLRPGLHQDLRHGLRVDLRRDLAPGLHRDLRHRLQVDLRRDLGQELLQDPEARPDERTKSRPEARPSANLAAAPALCQELLQDPEARPDVRPKLRPEARPSASLAAAQALHRVPHRRQVAPLRVDDSEATSEADEWVRCVEASDRRVQMSAVSVAPREPSPDHFGLRCHLAKRPEEAPRRKVANATAAEPQRGSEPDPSNVWLWPAGRRH